MRIISAQSLCEALVNDFRIKERAGNIQIVLGEITANYGGKDAIGDLLQGWLGEWLKSREYFYRLPENSQAFPDFILNRTGEPAEYLELKTFNADASSPAFDIANFDSYCSSLLMTPERLDANYLIMSYRMENAELTIDDVWLKKVWEISTSSKDNPIKIQKKRGMIYNLRPCRWYSERTKYRPFESAMEFLEAISETQKLYTQCEAYRVNWLINVVRKYEEATGRKIS